MYFGLLILISVSVLPIVTEADLCCSSNVTSKFNCWAQVLASFITDLRVRNFIRVRILYTVSLFLLSFSCLNLVIDIGSGSTQTYAEFFLCYYCSGLSVTFLYGLYHSFT